MAIRKKTALEEQGIPPLSQAPKIHPMPGPNGATMYDRLVDPGVDDQRLFGQLMAGLFGSPTGDLVHATMHTLAQRMQRTGLKDGQTAEYVCGYLSGIQECLDWFDGYIKAGKKIEWHESEERKQDATKHDEDQTPYASAPPLV